MVTDQQVDHYQTFGFLVLPGYLDEQETAELRDELDRALGDGYGAHLVDRKLVGILAADDEPPAHPDQPGPGRGRPLPRRGPPAAGRPGAVDLCRRQPAVRRGRLPHDCGTGTQG
jgi:hypothetical protein